MILGLIKQILKLGFTFGVIIAFAVFSFKYKTSISLQGEHIIFQSQYGLFVIFIIFLMGFLIGILFEKIKSLIFD